MSSFRALALMGERGQDVAIGTTVMELRKVKQGGLVTVGVDETTFNKLMGSSFGAKRYVCFLCVADKDTLDQTIQELKESKDETE